MTISAEGAPSFNFALRMTKTILLVITWMMTWNRRGMAPSSHGLLSMYRQRKRLMVVNVTNGGSLLKILWFQVMVPVWLRSENILPLSFFNLKYNFTHF